MAKNKKKLSTSIDWCRNHKCELLLAVSILAYIAYFTLASFLRYINFYTGRFDLGNMDQTVWNTAHGRIFQLTNPDGTNIISRLSIHADFILILLAPFYWLWQDPKMLLLIQTVVLSLGVLFVYLLGIDIIKNKWISFVLAFLYLLNPAVQFTNLYDFHGVTLATTFFLACFYFLKKKKIILFLLFLFLAGTTKEEAWVVVALFGIYAFFIEKRKLLGSSVFIIGSILFYVIFFKAIPQVRGGQHFAVAFYSDFGNSPASILKTIFLSPQKTITTVFQKDKIIYLLEMLFPLGFLSLFAPLVLIFTLPDLAVNLLSSNPTYHQIFYQYTAIITSFIFIAAIYGVKNITKLFPKITTTKISIIVLGTTLISAYLFGPLPGARLANVDMFTKQLSYAYAIDDFLKDIPTRYSIAASNNIGSHLSHRQKIYTIPTGLEQADVVVFLLNDSYAQPSLAAQKQMASKLSEDPNYVELFRDQDFVAYAKKSLNYQKRLRREIKYLPFLRRILPRN